MVKKKFSGQTIAIIILAVLLLITIAFGGVYAFYTAKSNKISGKIVMANLKISLVTETDKSDKSEIVISNGVNVVPGQPLENSPLIVKNLSSVGIYLVVVYEINAKIEKTVNNVAVTETVKDEHKSPVLGLGFEYINSVYPDMSSTRYVDSDKWIDYVFHAEQEDTSYEDADGEIVHVKKMYRCLVSMVGFAKEEDVTVIGENKLSLAAAMGDEYQSASISFTFQAYAIGDQTFNGQFNEDTTKEAKCEAIVSAIYESQNYKFLNIKVNS